MRKDVDRDRVVEMYASGMSTKEIGKTVGLTPGAIRSILIIRGVTLRNVKESLKAKYPDGRYGAAAANWKGGKRDMGTYIAIHAPEHPHAMQNGYVLEQRLVMEAFLGRYLTKAEEVHHKNTNPKDNRLDNLILVNKKSHKTLHYREWLELQRYRSTYGALPEEP